MISLSRSSRKFRLLQTPSSAMDITSMSLGSNTPSLKKGTMVAIVMSSSFPRAQLTDHDDCLLKQIKQIKQIEIARPRSLARRVGRGCSKANNSPMIFDVRCAQNRTRSAGAKDFSRFALCGKTAHGGRVSTSRRRRCIRNPSGRCRKRVEYPGLEKATAAYDSPAYAEALKALGHGAVRDFRIVEGVE
jgi:hypothetical protein